MLASLGTPIAEHDALLDEAFVETASLKHALSDASRVIIHGRKGAGKTALAIRLAASPYAVRVSAGFAAGDSLMAAYNQAASQQAAREAYARAWRELICIEAARVVVRNATGFASADVELLSRCLDSLDSQGGSAGLWGRVVETAASGLDGTGVLRGVLQAIGMTLDAPSLETVLATCLGRRNLQVSVLIDDVDKNWNTLAGPEWDCVRGLVDAAISLRERSDPLRDRVICRCFLPTHPFVDHEDRHWDKISPFMLQLHWKAQELFELLTRRLAVAYDLGAASLQEAWLSVFPARIGRRDLMADEDSFEYLLRHSFWRPRDLLSIWMGISEETSEESIAPDALRAGVTTGCWQIYRHVIEETRDTVPRAERLMSVMMNQLDSAIIARGQLSAVLADAIGTGPDDRGTEQALQALWRTGVMGYLPGTECVIPASRVDGAVRYSHSHPSGEGLFRNATTLVLHPILRETLNLHLPGGGDS